MSAAGFPAASAARVWRLAESARGRGWPSGVALGTLRHCLSSPFLCFSSFFLAFSLAERVRFNGVFFLQTFQTHTKVTASTQQIRKALSLALGVTLSQFC